MSHTPGDRLTVAADAVVNMKHHTAVVMKLPLANSGREPLDIVVRVHDWTKAAQQHPGVSWVTQIHPSRLVLKPGQTKWITFVLRVPRGVRGTHLVNYVASAVPAGQAQGRIGAGVGGTIRMVDPGFSPALPAHLTHPHIVPPASPGIPPWLFVLLGLIVVATIAAGVVLRHRRNAATA